MRTMTMLAASNPVGHVLDVPLIGGWLSMHMVTLVVAALLLIWVMNIAAKAIATGPDSLGHDRYVTKGAFSHMIEVVVLYLRNTVIRPQLGPDTDKFLPYLLTVFFFILINNLLGLVPLLDLQHLFGLHTTWIGGTATGNFAVTTGLATIAFLVININGIRRLGFKDYVKHFTGGVPFSLGMLPVILIMIPVEIMGLIIKPAALAIRLFANMTAGHVLLAVLIGFTLQSLEALGPAGGGVISVISIVAAVAIMFLEIFVALLQAFIFMFLTCLFIAQLNHHHHDDHAEERVGVHGGEPVAA